MRYNQSVRKNVTNEEDFKKLLRYAEKSDNPVFDRFMLYCLGRLTMRVGEFIHIKINWLDLQRKTITIPKYEPCSCSYCRQHFLMRTKRKSVDDKELMKTYWNPKTDNAHRTIPYDINNEIVYAVESYFEKYDTIPFSLSNVKNRFKNLCKRASIDTSIHSLRTASATKFIRDGVPHLVLKTLMGWNDLDTANKYIWWYKNEI